MGYGGYEVCSWGLQLGARFEEKRGDGVGREGAGARGGMLK